MSLFGTKKPKPEVICIGSISKDIFFPTSEGSVLETPEDLTAQRKIVFELGGKIKVDDRFESIGGVAANVSWGLSKLGLCASCYSRVGDDELGRWACRQLQKARVDTSHLVALGDTQTDLSAIIVVEATGERTIFHNRDANEKLTVIPDHLTGAKWVFLSALNGPWRENIRIVLDAQQQYGFRLALNPGQHNLKEDPRFIHELCRHVEILILNKDEALELVQKVAPDTVTSELEDELKLLQTLHAWGPQRIAMTDGLRGAWASANGAVWHGEATVLRGAKDTTGAGDAFASGFLAALFGEQPIQEALKWGLANSGSSVKAYGGVDGLLAPEAIQVAVASITPVRLA